MLFSVKIKQYPQVCATREGFLQQQQQHQQQPNKDTSHRYVSFTTTRLPLGAGWWEVDPLVW